MNFIYKYSSNPTYSNPLTIWRENNRYEVLRRSDNKVAFTNRKPRKDWRGWQSGDYFVWDLENKEQCKR